MKARFALGLVALISGCGTCGMCNESTRSSYVRTNAVRADIDVVSEGHDQTEVRAKLRVGGLFSNVFLELGDGDVIVATRGADKVGLALQKDLIFAPAFVGELSGDSSGATIVVDFVRPHDVSTRSKVEMPPALTFSMPHAGATFTAAGSPTVAVAWSPTSTELIEWSADGECIEEQHGTLAADPGRLAITPRTARLPDGGVPSACDVTLVVKRRRTGTLDAAFGQGGIAASQSRAVVVRFVP
jgi:hypothetical protein